MPWRRQPERSELVHVVVTGHQKRKYPRKYYVFVIDVTWNNSDRFEIYRRYSEFFSFQTTLKALFPSAAGRRNEERTIPQLPKRIFMGRSHVARVAEARVEQINRYCQTLVSLDPRISESTHVIGFFSPRIGDKGLPKLHLHRPASLHPQKIPAGSLFEEYCALAEYQAEDPSQVSFSSGQIVLVLSKDGSGWWMCQVNDKIGWGPPSYLKRVDKGESTEGESDSDDEYLGLPGFVDSEKEGGVDSGISTPESKDQISSGGKAFNVPEIEFQEYKAIDSYEAQGDGQVSFEEGDIIQVLDKIEDGWWFVAKGQEEGWVPCSYLEPLKVGQDEDDTISSLDVERYITVETYTAEEEDELSFPKGVIVDVLQKSLDGWWLVKHGGKAALAPATFLVKRETSSEDSPPIVRKASVPDIEEEGVKSQSKDEEDKLQAQEQGVNTLTRSYRQPPRKQSVRKRVSKKKSRQLATNGLRAPPTIREELRSPTPSQARKLSLEYADPTKTITTLTKHDHVARKLSPSPTRSQPRKLSLESADLTMITIPPTKHDHVARKLSPSPTRSQPRKLSLESADPTMITIPPTKHDNVARKLSEHTIPTQERVLINPHLPGQRKISLDAALSGAPKIAADGSLVHPKKRSPETSKSPITIVDSDTDDHEYFNIDPQAYLQEKRQQKLKELQQKITSPATSDSEVDTSSSWNGRSSLGGSQPDRKRVLQNQIRQWERRLSSDSEDSISSPPMSTRRPIATPRAKKPDLKPKPKLVGNQQVPPRPHTSQISRARGKVGAQKEESQTQLKTEQQPHMPKRPRGTEIRRARQGKPSTSPVPSPITSSQTPTPPPSTPTITATNDKGDHVVLSSRNSAFKPVTQRQSPSPSRPGLAMVREESIEEAEPAAGSRATNQPRSPRRKSSNRSPSPSVSTTTSGVSLAPPKPIRKDRSQSENDTRDSTASPTVSPSSSPVPPLNANGGEGNPFNQQMAETLIKYILASQDSGLKSALRDCIMSNPEAVQALQK